MRSVSVSVLLVAGSLGLSCSDMGALTPSGLSITVPQIRYHLSDTLRFTIVNTGDQKYLLGASNGKLTYFLQSGTYGNWQDRDSINLYLGPTLAIYAPIVLSPGRSRVESLALS